MMMFLTVSTCSSLPPSLPPSPSLLNDQKSSLTGDISTTDGGVAYTKDKWKQKLEVSDGNTYARKACMSWSGG